MKRKRPMLPPPSLEEARERLHKQADGIRRTNQLGPKLGKYSELDLIRSANVSDAADRFMDRYLGPGGGQRARIAALGEWLCNVIKSKNSEGALQRLCACLAAESPPLDNRTADYKFANALSGFLHGSNPKLEWKLRAEGKHVEAEAMGAKGFVPTLAQLRQKLGWSHEQNRKVAIRLKWDDLKEGTSGRPAKTLTVKKKKRG